MEIWLTSGTPSRPDKAVICSRARARHHLQPSSKLAPTELAPPDVGGKKDLCAFFKLAFRSQLRDVWYRLNADSRHAAVVEQWKRADRR